MERIEGCIGFLLGKAYQAVNQSARKRLAPFGITPVQYIVLKALWEKDGQSGAELGQRLQLDPPTITGLLDRLEQARLVDRRSDPSDRRINRLFLTPKGRQRQGPLDKAMDEMNAEVVDQLGSQKAHAFWRMLGELAHVDPAPPPPRRRRGRPQ